MKYLRRIALPLAVALGALMSPSTSSAQIDVGLFGLVRTMAANNKHLIGLIHVPYRPLDSVSYEEEWTLQQGEPLLLPNSVVHVHSAHTLRDIFGSRQDLDGPTSQVTAWSEEESFDVTLDFASVVTTTASPAAHGFHVGEIVQRWKDGDESEDISVGWVLEWTTSDGLPTRQEWWLTDDYQYPSMSDLNETFIRTLDPIEYASQGQKAIKRRIMVEMSPPTTTGVYPSSPSTIGCATGGSPSVGLGEFALGLLALAGARRRRRPSRV